MPAIAISDTGAEDEPTSATAMSGTGSEPKPATMSDEESDTDDDEESDEDDEEHDESEEEAVADGAYTSSDRGCRRTFLMSEKLYQSSTIRFSAKS